MRINPLVYGVIVVTVFFGIILGFQSAGIWSISGKVDASGKAIQPSTTDVETIKGWMTFEQITTTYNVTLDEIFTAFALPADTLPTTAIKDLETDTFSSEMLKEWLQSQILGIDIDTTPAFASELTPTPNPLAAETPVATEHVATVGTITGNTTFQNLLDWNLPIETIQTVIGGEMPALSMKVKDYATGKGLEFSTLKTALQVELDKLK